MSVHFDYTGQHVVVFGGTTGINFGIACAFAQGVEQRAKTSRHLHLADAELVRDLALGLVVEVAQPDQLQV